MYESLLSKSNVTKQEKSSWIMADTTQIKQNSRAGNYFIQLINWTLFLNLTHVSLPDGTFPYSHSPDTVYSSRFQILVDRYHG